MATWSALIGWSPDPKLGLIGKEMLLLTSEVAAVPSLASARISITPYLVHTWCRLPEGRRGQRPEVGKNVKAGVGRGKQCADTWK